MKQTADNIFYVERKGLSLPAITDMNLLRSLGGTHFDINILAQTPLPQPCKHGNVKSTVQNRALPATGSDRDIKIEGLPHLNLEQL